MRSLRNVRNLAFWFALIATAATPACKSDSVSSPSPNNPCSKKIEGTRVELTGFIEQISADRMIICSTGVVTNAQTRIEGDHGSPLGLVDLIVGMWVEVEGELLPNNDVLAEEIDVKTRDNSSTSDRE